MNYRIRWATVDDSEKLGFIHTKSWQVAYKNIIPKEVLEDISLEERKKRFEKAIENSEEQNAVLIVDEKIVGFITLGKCRDDDFDDSVGEIWGIYLLSSYWRKGLGSVLLSWGVKELKNRGYEKVTLWVLKDNKEARKFYEEKGFAKEGKIEEIKIGNKSLEKIRYKKTLNNYRVKFI